MGKPLSYACSNPHRNDRWTCSACYEELGNVGEGDHACPKCNRLVHCSLEWVPTCTSEIDEDVT